MPHMWSLIYEPHSRVLQKHGRFWGFEALSDKKQKYQTRGVNIMDVPVNPLPDNVASSSVNLLMRSNDDFIVYLKVLFNISASH